MSTDKFAVWLYHFSIWRLVFLVPTSSAHCVTATAAYPAMGYAGDKNSVKYIKQEKQDWHLETGLLLQGLLALQPVLPDHKSKANQAAIHTHKHIRAMFLLQASQHCHSGSISRKPLSESWQLLHLQSCFEALIANRQLLNKSEQRDYWIKSYQAQVF